MAWSIPLPVHLIYKLNWEIALTFFVRFKSIFQGNPRLNNNPVSWARLELRVSEFSRGYGISIWDHEKGSLRLLKIYTKNYLNSQRKISLFLLFRLLLERSVYCWLLWRPHTALNFRRLWVNDIAFKFLLFFATSLALAMHCTACVSCVAQHFQNTR